MLKPRISRIVIFGDSLSDYNRMQTSTLGRVAKFFKQIPHSPYGRFTNGYAWSDWLKPYILSNRLKDSASDLINAVYTVNYNPQHLPGDIDYKKFQILNYSIGGATAANFKDKDLQRERYFKEKRKSSFQNKFLSNLEKQYKNFIRSDRHIEVLKRSKDLYIIWAGANDFITAGWNNSDGAKAAVDAIKILIFNLINDCGAKNFLILNLPYFTSSPRFRVSPIWEKARLDNTVDCFNLYLKGMVDEFLKNIKINFNSKIQDINITIQDMTSILKNLHNNNYLKLEYGGEVFPTKITNPSSLVPFSETKQNKRPFSSLENNDHSPTTAKRLAPSEDNDPVVFRKARVSSGKVQRLSKGNMNNVLSRTSALHGSPFNNPYIENSSEYAREFIKKAERKGIPLSLSAYAYHDDVHPGKEIHHLLGVVISKNIKNMYEINPDNPRRYSL